MNSRIFILSLVIFLSILWIGCDQGKHNVKLSADQELFLEASKYNNESKPDSAINKYRELLSLYPKSKYAPEAQFKIGFIYANDLKEFEKAKEAYKLFLAKYSGVADKEMISVATYDLKNLGLDYRDRTDEGLDGSEYTPSKCELLIPIAIMAGYNWETDCRLIASKNTYSFEITLVKPYTLIEDDYGTFIGACVGCVGTIANKVAWNTDYLYLYANGKKIRISTLNCKEAMNMTDGTAVALGAFIINRIEFIK